MPCWALNHSANWSAVLFGRWASSCRCCARMVCACWIIAPGVASGNLYSGIPVPWLIAARTSLTVNNYIPFQNFPVCKSALTAPRSPTRRGGGVPQGVSVAESNKIIFYFSVGRMGSMFIDAKKDKKLPVTWPPSALESVRVFTMSRCKSSRAFNSSSIGHGGT